MAFDGIVTKSIVKELSPLIGSKIDKIYQPDKNTIMLILYSQGNKYNLNICIDAHNCRINLSNHQKPNPTVAPNFCMLLRKHILGGRVTDISLQGLERLINIQIEILNEFNEIEFKTLIIELMGKHSNIILINSKNIIIDAMRHINSKSSYREIIPSRYYILPNSDKFDFTALKDFEEFNLKFIDIDIDNLAKKISNTFTGFSLSFVQSAINKCNGDLHKMYNYFWDIVNGTKPLEFEVITKNKKLFDYILSISNSSEYQNLNEFIDNFYFERDTTETFENSRNTITKKILDVLKKYNNRLNSINTKLKECDEMDKYRLYGELITSNLYRLSNIHSSSIELENYYNNNNLITIPLDTKYSPNINAKRYFKKYAKLKNAFEFVSIQKKDTEQEINYIESIIYELEIATNIEDVQEIFEEISENIIFKEHLKKKENKKKNKKSKKYQSYSPIQYEIDNFKIYVGRNNKENDWLTHTFANKNDIWFHTKDIQGSHVILKTENKNINEDILVKCAKIAAKHSKAQNSSNVPVDYCLVKFVKKPQNVKPGMVVFSNNKTLNVQP